MARASNIYLVETDRHNTVTLAAFTVKHECKSWVEKHQNDYFNMRIKRIPDGAEGAHFNCFVWTVKGFLESK